MDATGPPPPKAGVRPSVAVGCIVLGLGGAFLVGLIAAIAIPNYVSMASRAKRAEVPSTVEAIRTAQLAHQASFERFIPCGSELDAHGSIARSGGKSVRDFNPEGDPCWDAMGWGPDGQIRGAYWVEVATDGGNFTVTGISDMDGDGELATFVATRESATRIVSPRDAY